jgi:hypothetical protein
MAVAIPTAFGPNTASPNGAARTTELEALLGDGSKQSLGKLSQADAQPKKPMALEAPTKEWRFDPSTGRLSPVSKALPNRVTVGNVSVIKYPPPEDLARVPTGKNYPRDAVEALNATVHILDDFRDFVVPIGSGGTLKAVTHGGQSLKIAQNGLPGAHVVALSYRDSQGNLSADTVAAAIQSVITDAKVAQKTDTPNLGRSFISMSLADGAETLMGNPKFRVAVAKYVALGGTLYASAGNHKLNTTSTANGIGLVFASRAVVGSDLGVNPQPVDSLQSGSFDLTVNGTPLSRLPSLQLGESTHAYVGAGRLRGRWNPTTGGVEFQNAQGQWRQAFPSNEVAATRMAGVGQFGALENQKMGKQITATEAADFDRWALAQEARVLAQVQLPAGAKRTATFDDLTTHQQNLLLQGARQEYLKRFGSNAVLSVANFMALANIKPGSERGDRITQLVPSQLNTANSFLSGEDILVLGQAPDKLNMHFYSRDMAGQLKTQFSYSSSGTSTSVATPEMVVRAVIHRARQVQKAIEEAKSDRPFVAGMMASRSL